MKNNEYIVRVKDPNHIDGLIKELKSWNVEASNISKVGFIGFTANLSSLISRWYSDDSRIEKIEKSTEFELQTIQQITSETMWYLDRIDQPTLPLAGAYSYINTGAGVTIYTIDSGISPNHTELSGKVTAILDPNQIDTVFDPIIDQRIYDGHVTYDEPTRRGVDELGHGTFIAGLLVSNTYGVAKNANVRSAKVFGQLTTTSGRILAGLNAIKQDYINRGKPKSILNISFAGLGPKVQVSATNSNNVATPSSFNINSNTINIIAGTSNEIVTKINALHLSGITAELINGRISITLSTLGALVLTDGINSPLASLGIPTGSHQNLPTLVEAAMLDLINEGMSVTISAGNYGIDASLVTPARISAISPALTVGSTDNTDTLANFANFPDNESTLSNITYSDITHMPANLSCFGPAVSLYAPGTSMESTWLNSFNTTGLLYNETMVSSGTSFSSPLVAGALALVLESANMIPIGLKNFILSNTSSGVISGLTPDSNNRLLNITSVDQSITWIDFGPYSDLPKFTYQELFLKAITYRGTPISYSIEDGILPVGLSLDSNTGKISGIMDGSNSNGVHTITVKAMDGSNNSPSDPNGLQEIIFSILENDQPVRWYTNEDLGNVVEGDPINIFLSAGSLNESIIPVEFSVVGNLPFGWSLIGDTIFGTAPIATNGDFETGFTINAWDGTVNTPRTFKIVIEQIRSYKPDNEPRWITPTGQLGIFIEDTEVVIQLLAEDDNSEPLPLTYNLTVTDGDGSSFGPFGELPTGLSLDIDTGIISGTLPTVASGASFQYEFAVYLSDGANVVANFFSILVIKPNYNSAPIWDTPEGNVGAYPQNQNILTQFFAHDLTGLPITYFLISGQLPPGLSLAQTGVLSGIMTANTDDFFVFTILASNGTLGTPRTFSIKGIKENNAPEWAMAQNLGSFDEGQFINIELVATDIDGDDLSFYSNNLPGSLYIQGNFLRGTLPEVENDEDVIFDITVTDILSNPDNGLETTQEFTLTVIDGALNPNYPPNWLTPQGPLQSGITNQPYIFSLIAVDPENSPITYQLVGGMLPPGLTLDQITGNITGTIGAISQDTGYDFIISASDGTFSVNRTFNIFVSSIQINLPPVWITLPNLGTVVDGSLTTFTFIANDPEGTVVSYSLIGGIVPPGMLFNSTTGQLSGIPSIGSNQVEYQFTVRATDFNFASSDQNFTLIVTKAANEPPVWITPPGQLGGINGLIEYHPGDVVSFQFQGYDPDDGPLPLTYRLAIGSSLPYGLALTTDGQLTGLIGDVYETQEINFVVELLDGANVVPRIFMIKFVPTPAYGGITTDLYVPLSMDLVKMLKEWNVDALIPDSVLYEPGDPSFGRVNSYDILVANNIHSEDKNLLQDILGEHHKKFSALMGIPTYAIGRDNYGNHIYDVIYIPMLDPQKGSDFSIQDFGSLEYYSHSFDNIREEILVFENNERLPSWMRSEQDGDGTVLGYVPAIVLAYVQPGQAKNIVQLFTQIINQTSFNIQETTFDRHVLLAEKVNATVTSGSQMVVEGVIVTFTGGDVYSAKTDIETALLNAGKTSIRIYVEDSVEYQTIGGIYGPIYGPALRFNYASNYLTISNLVGTPCEELGFRPQVNIETTFDGQTIHFDYMLILDEKQNIQSDGLNFVGKELLFDRYVGTMSNGQQFQLKWAPDYQERFYDSHKEEFWSKNPPVFITPPGELGPIPTALPTTIQLRTKHHLADQTVSYKIVFGSLPTGFTLNSSTGIITGVAGEPGETTFFTVRAYDKWDNYYDRGFTITTGLNLLRINQFIILLDGKGIKI